MTGQVGGGRRIFLGLVLIGFLGLVTGIVISGFFFTRGPNLIEVTRIVEVTRPIEVTRSVIEMKVIEVTRIVEVVNGSELQNESGSEAVSESTGSAIIGVLTNNGRISVGTHTVALFPKTIIDETGAAQPNRDQEISVPVNEQTGFAEAYGLPAGTYAVCFKSLLHTAAVGEIEIVAGEITRVDLRWPADLATIRVECVL